MRAKCPECERLLGDGLSCTVCDDYAEFMRNLQDEMDAYPERWLR